MAEQCRLLRFLYVSNTIPGQTDKLILYGHQLLRFETQFRAGQTSLLFTFTIK